MNIVLLSGGSGKRLWPLSNNTMSKQFLSLLPSENGTESMVQRVYRQIKAADPDANIAVSTNKTQQGSLHRQLGTDIGVVVEPERRNTFPAVLLSSAYMFYQKGMSPDDVVIVVPIDVFADDTYFSNLYIMEKLLKDDTYKLVLMGAKPNYPSEKYGYIVPRQYNQGGSMQVKEFKEKPDVNAAKALIKDGALWNCGIFGFKLSYAMDILQASYKVTSYQQLLDNYDKLISDSFDYQVVEKEKSIGVIEYVGVWKDLGTWNTLTEEMGTDSIGQDVYISDSCNNTHVLNMLDTPIITMGLKNVVVVASHDGILVSEKTESSYLKPYADKIKQRPMYEQRLWGEYRVLDYITDSDGNATLTKRLHIKPGMQISYQYHNVRTEVWTISKGEGILLMEGERKTVRRGDIVHILPTVKHAIQAVTDLEFIEVQMGDGELIEDDIVRISNSW